MLESDRYVIEKLIGDGAFGVVYQAVFSDHDDEVMRVAVKVHQPSSLWEFYIME